jgi:hypothetical protein
MILIEKLLTISSQFFTLFVNICFYWVKFEIIQFIIILF